MCGLFGAYCPSTLTAYEAEHVRELMILNHWRGSHSTGLFSYTDRPKDGVSIRYIKTTDHPVTFAFKSWKVQEDKHWSKDRPDIIACHVRHATVGEITKENAHPFIFKNLIGMHNGTVQGDYPDKKKFGTDSEALFAQISNEGIEKAVAATEKATSAAYALVWLDTVTNKLNFLRNYQRPLHFIIKNGSLYWSSEARDLRWVFNIESPVITPTLKEEDTFAIDKIFSAPVNTLISFDITKTGFGFTTKKVEAPTKAYQRSYGNFGGIEGGDDFFRSRSSGNGSISNNNIYSIARYETKPHFVNRTTAQWEWLGSEIKTTWKFCFALEFKKFYSVNEIEQLQAWRAEYPHTFLGFFKKSWESYSKAEQREVLKLLGVSRNEVKQLINKKDFSFIYEPFHIGMSNQRVYNASVKRYYSEEKKRTLINPLDDPPFDNIITLPEASEKDLKFCTGVSKTPCTEQEYLKAVDKGCAWCSDPISLTEDLFWIDDDDFLCENCQDDAIECAGYHQMEEVLNLTGLQEHVGHRLKKTNKAM